MEVAAKSKWGDMGMRLPPWSWEKEGKTESTVVVSGVEMMSFISLAATSWKSGFGCAEAAALGSDTEGPDAVAGLFPEFPAVPARGGIMDLPLSHRNRHDPATG